jgi:DNA-binding IclR family transcriptional regulator
MPETIGDVIELERQQRLEHFQRARKAAIEVLTELPEKHGSPSELVVQEISRRTRLHPSDIQWTLATLVNKGEIIKDGYSYRLP